jgi:nicotinamidase-related amidase
MVARAITVQDIIPAMSLTTAILVIDFQEKLVPAVHEGEQVVQQATRLLQFAHLMGIPLIATEQVPQKLGATVSELRSLVNWPVPFTKSTFSAGPVLSGDLPENLIVVGLETHVCVRQTVFDLQQRRHQLTVLADAVSSRRALDHDLALQEMRSAGVRITSVEALAFALLGSAEHPQFRTAHGIFK